MLCGLFGSDISDGRYLVKLKHLKDFTEITSKVILVNEVQLNGMDLPSVSSNDLNN